MSTNQPIDPPAFKKSNYCTKCNKKFSMFGNKRHHCRNCGQSFCDPCSDKSIPISKYGFNEAVRVCESCYIKIVKGSPATENKKTKVEQNNNTSTFSNHIAHEPLIETAKPKIVKSCTCGMPLCICPPDKKSPLCPLIIIASLLS